MEEFERGVMGPDGRWLKKHGYTAPPNVTENTYNRLRGVVADRAQRAEWIVKGEQNIKGANLTTEIHNGMRRAGVLKYLTRLGPVLGVAGVVLGAPSDKQACQYANYEMWQQLNCGL